MKNAKRILVAILAIALVMAVFAFSVSAEDELKFRGEGIKNFDDILEYYETENFIDLDFGESDWNANKWQTPPPTPYYDATVVEVIADSANDQNKLLNTKLQWNMQAGFKVENTSSLVEQMIVSFDIMFNENCMQSVYYDINVTLPSGKNYTLNGGRYHFAE